MFGSDLLALSAIAANPPVRNPPLLCARSWRAPLRRLLTTTAEDAAASPPAPSLAVGLFSPLPCSGDSDPCKVRGGTGLLAGATSTIRGASLFAARPSGDQRGDGLAGVASALADPIDVSVARATGPRFRVLGSFWWRYLSFMYRRDFTES